MKKSIPVLLSTIALGMSAMAFANCPSASGVNQRTICVMNNTNQTVVYSQFPNDFGDLGVPARQSKSMGEAKPNSAESVSLQDGVTGKFLVENKSISSCQTLAFHNNKNQLKWKVVRGCVK